MFSFGLKKCDECGKGKDEDFNKFQIKRELERIKIHRNYVCCICVGIVVWLIATGTYADKEFTGLVSFASTITSIILSVIAIIMSITGESKTEMIKDQIEEATFRLDKAVDDISTANKEMKESLIDLQNKIDSIGDKVDEFTKQNNGKNLIADVNMKDDIIF